MRTLAGLTAPSAPGDSPAPPLRADAAMLPRLLAGLPGDGSTVDLAAHEGRYGPLPRLSSLALIDEVERSGLRGRGGAGFPTAVKLRTVASKRRVSAVIVKSTERPSGNNAGQR